MFDNLKKYSEFSKDDDTIKIGLFIKEGSVSSDIRLLVPFNILAEDKHFSIYFILQRDYANVQKDLLNSSFYFDYIIIQRNALEIDFAKLLINKCKLLGVKIIYEIDDDLIHFDRNNSGYDYYHSIKEDLEYQISHADIVTVSTNNLKKMLSYLNKNILVIPNRLIEEWFSSSYVYSNPDNIIKIGYMGTPFHLWDLAYIEEAIIEVKEFYSKKNKQVIFELIGGTDESLFWANQIDVPVNCKRYLDFIPWFKNIAKWDIVIAPLEDNNLNFSKSELKYLEYSAIGLPGIYSDIGPYSQNIVREYNGLLVSNTTEDWVKNIIRLIEDDGLKENIVNNSMNEIHKNYLIKDSIRQWKIIFSCFRLDKK